MSSPDLTRRRFVQGSAALVAGAPVLAGVGWHRHAETIRVGVIGAGKFGSMFLSQALRTPGMQVMAVADLDVDRAKAALAGVQRTAPAKKR